MDIWNHPEQQMDNVLTAHDQGQAISDDDTDTEHYDSQTANLHMGETGTNGCGRV